MFLVTRSCFERLRITKLFTCSPTSFKYPDMTAFRLLVLLSLVIKAHVYELSCFCLPASPRDLQKAPAISSIEPILAIMLREPLGGAQEGIPLNKRQ